MKIYNVSTQKKGYDVEDKKVVSIGSKSKKNAAKSEPPKELDHCSFCKRASNQIPKLVKGPGVNICSECVIIATQYLILQDGMLSGEAQKILDLFWGQTRK